MANNDRQGHRRRQVLRIMGAAGVAAVLLPQTWTKPILRSVVVPAHAETTPAKTTKTKTPSTSAPTTQQESYLHDGGSTPKTRLAMIIDSLGLMKG